MHFVWIPAAVYPSEGWGWNDKKILPDYLFKLHSKGDL
jgi:hypothetical protein